MRRGKSQLTIKRAIFLAQTAMKLPAGTAAVYSPRELSDLFVRNDLANVTEKVRENNRVVGGLNEKNVLGSICDTVNGRVGCGWVFAFPRIGCVALYNAFTSDGPQSRAKKPDKAAWKAFGNTNDAPPARLIKARAAAEALLDGLSFT